MFVQFLKVEDKPGNRDMNHLQEGLTLVNLANQCQPFQVAKKSMLMSH